MNYGKYYLDVKKISKMKDQMEVDRIHGYYKDFLYSMIEGNNHRTESLFNTLRMSGYLRDAEQDSRDNKINQVLDADKG